MRTTRTMQLLRDNRWWIYQRERFPIIAHGILIAAFSFSGVCVATLLGEPSAAPSLHAGCVAFLVALLFFFLLRIADEFKDAEEDARYRPYRPVPRGLVSLQELSHLGGAALVLQLALSWWLDPRLLFILVGGWLYWGLMSKEFFIGPWLKRHHFTYMWTHMMIMVFIDLFTTACGWLPSGTRPPAGLIWFLLVSFFNGIVIEVGRKIQAPQNEEPGVATYSAVWGLPKAIVTWLAALLITTIFAGITAHAIRFFWPAIVLYGILFILGMWIAYAFLRYPDARWAKRVEMLSFFWTLCIYLSLGIIPMLVTRLPAS